ncbi:MAG: hypothetical protein IT176_00880 [Acidobacteria bacterium]|nr:hypothetical protein [Acidobacteriota bacterium]
MVREDAGGQPLDRETGEERQKRILQEQHRPEQNAGYDEAVRGGRPDGLLDLTDKAIAQTPPADEDVFDREARLARRDVRRQDSSAD